MVSGAKRPFAAEALGPGGSGDSRGTGQHGAGTRRHRPVSPRRGSTQGLRGPGLSPGRMTSDEKAKRVRSGAAGGRNGLGGAPARAGPGCPRGAPARSIPAGRCPPCSA